MEYIETIINQIINNFDFAYMLVINVLTYIIIKLIDYFNGDKDVSKIIKRFCLICSIIIVSAIYIYCNYNNKTVIVNSAILAPVFWSWVLKPICVKLNIDYKKIDKTLC